MKQYNVDNPSEPISINQKFTSKSIKVNCLPDKNPKLKSVEENIDAKLVDSINKERAIKYKIEIIKVMKSEKKVSYN